MIIPMKIQKEAIRRILQELPKFEQKIMFMHVCGTHQDTIVRHGLDYLLRPKNIELREGPGCPVCVTTPKEIELGIELARKGIVVTTFGDLLKCPGRRGSLADCPGEVKVVYSIEESIKYAKENKDKEVVFLAVGFETTMPLTAYYLVRGMPENHYVLSFHRFTPPAVEAVLSSGDVKIDGIILPGHVSTITGRRAWEFISKKFKIPQVVSGFEPIDVMISVKMLIDMLKDGKSETLNEYTRAVTDEGNLEAKRYIEEAFYREDVEWRGLGKVPKSGAKIREKYSEHDAERVFEDLLQEILEEEIPEPPGCRCGDVIRGAISPEECPLFGKVCTPEHPVGTCMVSSEGACAIIYKYRKGFL